MFPTSCLAFSLFSTQNIDSNTLCALNHFEPFSLPPPSHLTLAQPINSQQLLDSSILLGSAGVYVAFSMMTPKSFDKVANPSGIDAWIEPQWNPQWANPSDFLAQPYSFYGFNLPVLTTLGLGIWSGTQNGSQEGLQDSITMLQSIALTAAITEGLKVTVNRPRPFTSVAFQETHPEAYAGEYIQEQLQDEDAYKSFPSGHTSNAAATYFTSAAIIANYSNNPKVDIAAYSTASLLTGLTAYARVRYGKHHPTDTLAGAAIGTSIALGMVWWKNHR